MPTKPDFSPILKVLRQKREEFAAKASAIPKDAKPAQKRERLRHLKAVEKIDRDIARISSR